MRSHSHFQGFSAMRWGLIGLGVIVLAGPSARGATLRWKFKPGETLHYTMDQKTVTTSKIPGGQDQKSTLSMTTETTWAVKSVDASGTAELTQTIDRIRDQIEAPVGSYMYDSKDAKEPVGLIAAARVPLLKALIGATISFKMSPQGEPSEVHIPEKLAQTFRDMGPTANGPGAMFSEEGLKEMITQASLIVPQDNLADGKTWTRQVKNNVASLGMVVIDSTYRYEGRAPDAGPDTFKIAIANRVDIQLPAGTDANGNASPKMPNALKIRAQKSQGTFTFDNAAGHLLGSNQSELIEVGATIRLGQGNNTQEMELSQTTETTTIRKLVR